MKLLDFPEPNKEFEMSFDNNAPVVDASDIIVELPSEDTAKINEPATTNEPSEVRTTVKPFEKRRRHERIPVSGERNSQRTYS